MQKEAIEMDWGVDGLSKQLHSFWTNGVALPLHLCICYAYALPP